MALTRIRFDVAGEVQLSRAFEAAEREARDMSVPLAETGDMVVESVGQQFHTEGARSGAAWPSLSAAYAAWKDSAYPGRPLLVRTGAMRAQALDKARTLTVTARRLVYEVDDPKAIYHQRGEGHLPQRRLVDLTAEDRRQVDRIFANWLNGLRHRAFGPTV